MKIGFGAVGIKGGIPGNLDAINPGTFSHRDICIVYHDNKMWYYYMNQYSGEFEDYPYIIKPASLETGSSLISRLKRWKLISQEEIPNNIIQTENDYIQTSLVKALSGSGLELEAYNGSTITVNTDGTVEFQETVAGIDPIYNSDFTTKKYMDAMLQSLNDAFSNWLDNYIASDIYLDDNLDTLDSDIRAYVIDYIDNDTYLDSELDTLDSDIRSYVDSEVSDMETDINNNYKRMDFYIDTWTASGDLYYADITHNLGTNHDSNGWDFLLTYGDWNWTYLPPYKIEIIDTDTLRIWNSTDYMDFFVVIFYIGAGYIT